MFPDPGARPASPAPDRAAGCRLLLVRHAKSVRKDEAIDDFDRPFERARKG